MIRKSLIIACTSILLWIGMAAAENFPPSSMAVVQDEQKVMEPSQVKQLSEIISKLPEKYKVVIIPSTDGLSTKDYTDQLFAHYQMTENDLLLVFNRDKEEVAIHAGSFFLEKGITDEWLDDKIKHFFVPYAKQKSYMTGLSTLIQQISDDVKNGVSAVAADQSNTEAEISSSERDEVSEGLPGWLYMILGMIALVISLGIYTYFNRRQLFKEMDEIEDWMDSIEEKLKQLRAESVLKKRKGDSATLLIDKFRKESLPSAEFYLLEAEAMCDRFRFRKSKAFLQQSRDILAQIDQEIGNLQSKIFQSKVTLEECEKLKAEIAKTCTIVERKLDEARFQYGVSFHDLRDNLAKVEQWMKTLPEDLTGDPSLFLEQLRDQKLVLMDILKQIDRFPDLKQEIFVTLEREIVQLSEGLNEMIEQGYKIPLDEYHDKLDQMREEVAYLQRLLEDGQMEGILGKADEIRNQIESFYDQIEEIVTKKNLVQHYMKEIPQMLAALDEERKQLKNELEELSLRYRVQEGAIFNYYVELQKVCKQLADHIYLAKQMDTGNDLELIQSADMLERSRQATDQLLALREEAYLELEELRKGEYEAQDTVIALHADIIRVEQQIRRENLPAVPAMLQEMIEEGKKSLFEIEMALNQIPLELQRVNALVRSAKEFNSKLVHHAESIFFHCRKAEEKIQQTNRFRRQWKDVNDLLVEAERAFRELDFEKAHLLARQAEELALEHLNGNGRSVFRKSKA